MSYTFSVPVYVYDVPQRCDVKVVSSDFVVVWYTDDDVLVIRRHSGAPKEVVAGRGDVVVGLDEHGRVVNVEVEFADFYYIDREEARRILRKARW
jgi:uncharacterized protein YuzE